MNLNYEAIESATSRFHRAITSRNVLVRMRPDDIYLHRQANERMRGPWLDLCHVAGEIPAPVGHA